jgi:uncharacterized Fe-S center protein
MGEDRVTFVYFFTDITKLSEACALCNLSEFSHQEVLVKLHMGEVKNKYFSKPSFIKIAIDELHRIHAHPILYDTTVYYPGPRHSVKGYASVARLHGFSKNTMGCDIHIDNEGIAVDAAHHLFEVGTLLHQMSHVLVISHVKGHNGTGMGGAIKNLGMGGVSKTSKKWIHVQAKPTFQQEKCTYCGICAKVCPFHAITVKNREWIHHQRKCFGCDACVQNCPSHALDHQVASLQYLIACAAQAAIRGKKVIYLNEVKRISRNCDCDPFAGPLICPDIGYLLSTDPVAIDHASLNLIYEQKPHVFKKEHHIDPFDQIASGETIGLGSSSYELITL